MPTLKCSRCGEDAWLSQDDRDNIEKFGDKVICAACKEGSVCEHFGCFEPGPWTSLNPIASATQGKRVARHLCWEHYCYENPKPSPKESIKNIPMGILYGRFGDGTLGASWWVGHQLRMKRETIARAEAEGLELVYEDGDSMFFQKKVL